MDREHIPSLVERVAETEHVPVAEDREDSREERRLVAVDRRPLCDEEADDRLRRSQPHGLHVRPAAVVTGQRGSGSCDAHVSRIHACAGSSANSSTRPGAGPAMTFK